MMTPEEARVLSYLRQHGSATATDVVRSCMSGATPAWFEQVVASLDWLGYLTVYYAPDGRPATLQITDEGIAQLGVHPAAAFR